MWSLVSRPQPWDLLPRLVLPRSLGKLRLLRVSELQPSHLHNSTVVGFLENFNKFVTCQVFGIIRGTQHQAVVRFRYY